jgi:hypothetical protein
VWKVFHINMDPLTFLHKIKKLQLIVFAYYNDYFIHEEFLANDLLSYSWNVASLTIIIAWVCGTIHLFVVKDVVQELFDAIKEHIIITTLRHINIIITHHLISIILHKHRLDNNQALFHIIKLQLPLLVNISSWITYIVVYNLYIHTYMHEYMDVYMNVSLWSLTLHCMEIPKSSNLDLWSIQNISMYVLF